MIRNGVSHRFDSGGVKVFQPGDRIVVIRANAAAPVAGEESPNGSVRPARRVE